MYLWIFAITRNTVNKNTAENNVFIECVVFVGLQTLFEGFGNNDRQDQPGRHALVDP